jgi:hypothetical protein
VPLKKINFITTLPEWSSGMIPALGSLKLQEVSGSIPDSGLGTMFSFATHILQLYCGSEGDSKCKLSEAGSRFL